MTDQPAKHTPGPWERSSSVNGRVLALFKKPDGDTYFWEIATAVEVTFPADDGSMHMAGGTMRDNARLISAAPDMLAALKEVVKRCGPKSKDGAMARDAIAKAEGRT